MLPRSEILTIVQGAPIAGLKPFSVAVDPAIVSHAHNELAADERLKRRLSNPSHVCPPGDQVDRAGHAEPFPLPKRNSL